MNTVFIGIDPGASGGMPVLFGDDTLAWKFDGLTEHDIAELIDKWTPPGTTAFIEAVGACGGGKDGRRQGANSMFTFGQSYGFLRGVLVGAKVRFEAVRPQVWLPAMGLRGIKDETTTAKKNRHKAKAQQLWPRMKITHATADALLLAEYGRRLKSGELQGGLAK